MIDLYYFKGFYSPNFFKKTHFWILMFFGTLNYGKSPYVIYFCCLELFMLLLFITKLTVFYLAADITTTFTCFKSQYYTRKSSFYFSSKVENPVKPRITKSRKNLNKQDKHRILPCKIDS